MAIIEGACKVASISWWLVRMRTALNFLPQKHDVYILLTKMAYSLSLISNYMDNSFRLKSRSNFLVFSSTGSSILLHISNIWKISVGKHHNYYELYPARIGVMTGQPYWGFTGRTTDPNLSIVYGSARRSYLAVLDPIANHGFRLCSGAFATSPIKSLQVETGEPSSVIRRLKLSLQCYMKMKANPENPAYSCVVNPEYKRLSARDSTYFGYKTLTPSGGHGGGALRN